jgi:hypothetical protein
MGEFWIRARSLLPQRHDSKDGEEADGDEGAFNETSRDIADSEGFVLPPEDRKQHDGGADVRDARSRPLDELYPIPVQEAPVRKLVRARCATRLESGKPLTVRPFHAHVKRAPSPDRVAASN